MALNWRATRRSSRTRDPRLAWRKSHVGYYLIGEGAKQLRGRAGVRLAVGRSAFRISCAAIRTSFTWAESRC